MFPGVAHWRLKKGEITVARFDGDNGSYSLLMGHAHSVEGPETSGTYLWIEVNDWPLWEEKFIRGPYIPELIPDAVDPDEEELKKWLRE